jgi:hypothetical protein
MYNWSGLGYSGLIGIMNNGINWLMRSTSSEVTNTKLFIHTICMWCSFTFYSQSVVSSEVTNTKLFIHTLCMWCSFAFYSQSDIWIILSLSKSNFIKQLLRFIISNIIIAYVIKLTPSQNDHIKNHSLNTYTSLISYFLFEFKKMDKKISPWILNL